MASSKHQSRAAEKSSSRSAKQSAPPPQATVSPRWLIAAVAIALAGAVLCAWGTLCLLFWQGSWQLLYHPASKVARTPAAAGVPFEAIGFAADETGQLRLSGWWIPAAPGAPFSRYTILYLHGATGNLGDSTDALVGLHALGTNILAFDYRGYGQSQFAHPSEARWLEDANWAFSYLTQTRHADPHSIVAMGNELGADLALEIAAAHPDLAGAILQSPVEDPASAIFNDSRAGLVPAHLLVKDRYDIDAAASELRVPSLWLLPSNTNALNAGEPTAFSRVAAPRQFMRVMTEQNAAPQTSDAISRWLAALPAH
jgi:hypothetical protein